MRKLILCLIFSASTAHADVAPPQVGEVAHLLEFVGESACTFHRNGSSYSGSEARAHIQKKYDYYRDEISDTESFIDYAASKSQLSGRSYTVECPGKTSVTTRQWLMDELDRFRHPPKPLS